MIPVRNLDVVVRADKIYDPDCRRCSRLANFLDDVHALHPGYFCRPVPPFGDGRAPLRRGRPRAGNAWGQRQRASVHGRSRRVVAVCDTVQVRFCHATDVDGHPTMACNWSGRGSPTRSNACRRQTSRCQPKFAIAMRSSSPTWHSCPPAPRSSHSALSRMRRACGRSASPGATSVRARCGTRSAEGRAACSTATIAAATTPTRGGSRPRCSRRSSRGSWNTLDRHRSARIV